MKRLLSLAFAMLLPASTPNPLAFPRDHGAHPDAPVEWWYYTGHLSDAAGRSYGFQLTFFRVHEIHLAHFAWTDASRRRFTYEQKTHLGLPGVASAAEGRLDVSNEDWSAKTAADGSHVLEASGRVGRLELLLSPAKPPVLHGPNGVSRKGAGPAEFSRYVSITRLAAHDPTEADPARHAHVRRVHHAPSTAEPRSAPMPAPRKRKAACAFSRRCSSSSSRSRTWCSRSPWAPSAR